MFDKNLFVIQLLRLMPRFEREMHAQLFQRLFVDCGEDDAGMELAAVQFGQLVERAARVFVGDGADGERHQRLIRMQPRIQAPHKVYLQRLHGFDKQRRNQLFFVVDPGERL